MSVRVTHDYAEVLVLPDNANVRVTHDYAEVLVLPDSSIRVTHDYAEVLVQNTTTINTKGARAYFAWPGDD